MEALVKRRILAFSLIELMVVIAIIALLAAVAVNSYKSYTLRSHISSLIPLADNPKNAVETSHNEGAIFGSSSTQTYIANGSSNIPFGLYSLTQVAYGCIDIRVDVAALGLVGSNPLILVLCPYENNGAIEWACGYDSTSYSGYLSYLPANCQTVNTSIQDTAF